MRLSAIGRVASRDLARSEGWRWGIFVGVLVCLVAMILVSWNESNGELMRGFNQIVVAAAPEVAFVSLLHVVLVLILIVTAVVAAFVWGRRQRLRCPKCPAVMEQLAPHEMDEVLSKAERAELRLDSVEFHVFRCRCGHSATTRKPRKKSPVRDCPECGYRTLVDRRDGPMAVEILRRCESCGFESAEPLGRGEGAVGGVFAGPAHRQVRGGSSRGRGNRGENRETPEAPREAPVKTGGVPKIGGYSGRRRR